MLKHLLLTAVLLAATAMAAQDAPFSIRVDAPLVTVDVNVSDASGRPVTDLTRDDFEVFEDGRPQQMQTFAPFDTPYSILLLIDRSRTMEQHWPLMEPAFARFIQHLKPQDRVSIGAFDERSKTPELLLDWREAQNGAALNIPLNPVIQGNAYIRITQSLGVGQTGGGSLRGASKDLYGAFEWALLRMASVSGRKGVLVFTDGRPDFPETRIVTVDDSRFVQLVDGRDDGDFRKALRSIQDSRARFDFVAVNTDLNPNDGYFALTGGLSFGHPVNFGMPVRARLEQLAASSGGRVALPKRLEDTLQLYADIAQNLGTSYTVGYAPPAAANGSSRRIEVRLKRQGLSVRQSRDTYVTR